MRAPGYRAGLLLFAPLMGCSGPSDAPPAEALSPNPPSWYGGTVPWSQVVTPRSHKSGPRLRAERDAEAAG